MADENNLTLTRGGLDLWGLDDRFTEQVAVMAGKRLSSNLHGCECESVDASVAGEQVRYGS